MDLQRSIEKLFSGLQWPQLLCAGLCVVLYVFCIDRIAAPALITSNTATSVPLWPMGLPRHDPRAFFSPPRVPDDSYRIAIVSSSSGIVYKSEFLKGTPPPTTPTADLICGYSFSEILAKRLPAVGGKTVKFYHYVQNGGRLEDFAMSVRHALRVIRPDAMIVGINPLLVGNDSMLFRIDSGRRSWNAEFLHAPFASSFEASLALRRPTLADFEFAATRQLFSLSDGRAEASDTLTAWLSKLMPAPAQEPFCRPGDEPRKRTLSTSISLARRYLGAADQSTTFASAYMADLLKHLTASRVPVYVFLEPFNPGVLSDPHISSVITARYQSMLASHAEMKSSNIAIDVETLRFYSDPENFTDYIHTINGDRLVDHLIGVIMRQVGGSGNQNRS